MSSEAEEGEGDAQTATAAGPPPAAPPTPSALEDVIRNWKDPSPEAARLAETGVPQLIALLAHVPSRNSCSEAFGLVRIPDWHRYTFRDKALAQRRYLVSVQPPLLLRSTREVTPESSPVQRCRQTVLVMCA